MQPHNLESRTVNMPLAAAIGLITGLALHAIIAFSVLGGGGDDAPARIPQATPVIASATATPAILPDRRVCAEIRGTDYRSASERTWFQANCT